MLLQFIFLTILIIFNILFKKLIIFIYFKTSKLINILLKIEIIIILNNKIKEKFNYFIKYIKL